MMLINGARPLSAALAVLNEHSLFTTNFDLAVTIMHCLREATCQPHVDFPATYLLNQQLTAVNTNH